MSKIMEPKAKCDRCGIVSAKVDDIEDIPMESFAGRILGGIYCYEDLCTRCRKVALKAIGTIAPHPQKARAEKVGDG